MQCVRAHSGPIPLGASITVQIAQIQDRPLSGGLQSPALETGV